MSLKFSQLHFLCEENFYANNIWPLKTIKNYQMK